MRRTSVRTLLVCLCLVAALAGPVFGAPVTQGDYALALAQVLGFEVVTIQEAVSSLECVRVTPDDGWVVEEPLTQEVIRQLEAALARALAAGLLKPVQVEGALVAAAAAVGFELKPAGPELDGTADVPWRAPIGGPQIDRDKREGSPFRAF